MTDLTYNKAKILWDSLTPKQLVTNADCIITLGSKDNDVARKATQSIIEGTAPIVVFSGRIGRLTNLEYDEQELVLTLKLP